MTRRKTAPAAPPPEAFDTEARYVITLTDESAYLTTCDRGQPVSTMPVQLSDLAASLNVFGSSTGLLPDDTLFWQNRDGQNRIAVYLPPARRTLRFGERIRHLTLPLPGFVFVGQGTSFHLWAVTERPHSMAAALYHAPLPNVYDDGRVCNGSVRFPKVGPDTIRTCATLFFESDFSYDLMGNGVAHRNAMKWLRGLAHKRAYPLAELQPATTLRQVMGQEGNHA